MEALRSSTVSHLHQTGLFREAEVLFIHHAHGRSAADARTTHFDWRHPLHLRAFRLVADLALIAVAVLAAAMLFWGMLSLPQWRLSAPMTDPAGNCVHFGRAGGYCPPGASDGSSKPADEQNCVSLGRAGHSCPAASP
jgi:hypothetical protein